MKKILFLFVVISSISFAQNYGIWKLTDSLNLPRNHAASVELANGNILVAGGVDSVNIKNAEIFDYKLEKWEKINSMIVGRSYFKLVRLENGNVLAIGGGDHSSSCEIFDTLTNTWTYTDSLNEARSGETATLMNNGNVLVVGGGNLNSCEIYNVNSAKWIFTDSLEIDRYGHTATKLLDGRVLVAGGFSNTKLGLSDCEIYDPITGKWSEAASLNIPRHKHTATLLKDGDVLVTGGLNYNNPQSPWLNSCELYDPLRNTWTIVDSLLAPRANHSAIMLKSDLLLFAGGDFASETWELYNPDNFSNVYIGNYPGRQDGPLINLLSNGKVLSAGGMTWRDGNPGDPPFVYPAGMCYLYDPEGINNIVDNRINYVKEFKLYQNYPNPFNPTTTIEYALPKQGFVNLSIYNILGKKVKTLVEKFQSSGKYSVLWNGKNEKGVNVSSGVYFYVLQAGRYSLNKKMIYLR